MKKKAVKKSSIRHKATKIKKGDNLVCHTCGFSVTVDEPCDCMDCHEIICCEEPMQVK